MLLARCAFAIALTVQGAAQEASPLARMTELNRGGEWGQAAQLARSFLESGAAKPRAERCEAFWSLAYAQTRLGEAAEARSTLKAFAGECQDLPPGSWLPGEVERLRKELDAPPAPAHVPPADGFWQRADPASLGLDVAALDAHRELCVKTGADACLVIRDGKIAQEMYSANYREPMTAMSSTKSVAGLLVGMLIDDGKIKSVDEPVCAYLPGWCEGRKGRVTIRHLLTMTSGLADTRSTSMGVGGEGDKNGYVTGLPLAHEPGSQWAYSNEGVQLLSPILDRAAGEPIQEYARRRLFEPLGMRHTRLKTDTKGHAWTYADMETTARDFARLGLLMLNKGSWEGRRIVSAGWVERSTRPSQEREPGYGLLWWLFKKPEGYAGLGHLDTNLYVFPAQRLVVVRMQSKPAARPAPYGGEAQRLFERFVRR